MDSDIPRRTIRRCQMGVVSLKRNKPVHAPETADATTRSSVALHVAPEAAVHGGLAQMFTPPPPDFWPRLAGGRS